MRELDLREALLEEHVLPLAHHAEVAVVDDHDHDRQPLHRRRRQLLGGHLEAAVAVDADDLRVRTRRLGADRRRQAVAHRAEAAGGNEGARPVAAQVLHRPHLVLADAGRPHDVVAARGQIVQRLEHELRLEHVSVASVAKRVRVAPLRDLPQPRLGAARPQGLAQKAPELGEHRLQRSDDGNVGVADLRDLGGVDVEVDHRRAGRERRQLPGDAVVEAGTDGDDHVRLV